MLRRTCPFGLSIAMVLLGCTGEQHLTPAMGADAGSGGFTPPSGAAHCPIDPDAFIGGMGRPTCPDYWICENGEGTGKICVTPGADLPDGSHDWECHDEAGTTICRGADFPDAGSGEAWNCVQSGEYVVCTTTTPDYPGNGNGMEWACRWEREYRVCEGTGTTPSGGGAWTCVGLTGGGQECRQGSPDFPPGGGDGSWTCYDTSEYGTQCTRPPGSEIPMGGGGWTCSTDAFGRIVCTRTTPDYPDASPPGAWNCQFEREFRVCRTPDAPTTPMEMCPLGAERWCDDRVYCSWGKQRCQPDNTWGPCEEPMIVGHTLPDRPNNDCGCRFFFFNYQCCEDQTDRDGDGWPDCVVPADHVPPTCEHTGQLCGFCDTDDHCAAGAACIRYSAGQLEGGGPSVGSFCGQDCSTAGCPDGYDCRNVGAVGGRSAMQCTPSSRAVCG